MDSVYCTWCMSNVDVPKTSEVCVNCGAVGFLLDTDGEK